MSRFGTTLTEEQRRLVRRGVRNLRVKRRNKGAAQGFVEDVGLAGTGARAAPGSGDNITAFLASDPRSQQEMLASKNVSPATKRAMRAILRAGQGGNQVTQPRLAPAASPQQIEEAEATLRAQQGQGVPRQPEVGPPSSLSREVQDRRQSRQTIREGQQAQRFLEGLGRMSPERQERARQNFENRTEFTPEEAIERGGLAQDQATLQTNITRAVRTGNRDAFVNFAQDLIAPVPLEEGMVHTLQNQQEEQDIQQQMQSTLLDDSLTLDQKANALFELRDRRDSLVAVPDKGFRTHEEEQARIEQQTVNVGGRSIFVGPDGPDAQITKLLNEPTPEEASQLKIAEAEAIARAKGEATGITPETRQASEQADQRAAIARTRGQISDDFDDAALAAMTGIDEKFIPEFRLEIETRMAEALHSGDQQTINDLVSRIKENLRDRPSDFQKFIQTMFTTILPPAIFGPTTELVQAAVGSNNGEQTFANVSDEIVTRIPLGAGEPVPSHIEASIVDIIERQEPGLTGEEFNQRVRNAITDRGYRING